MPSDVSIPEFVVLQPRVWLQNGAVVNNFALNH